MVNSKLNKLYLVSPESFTKLSKVSDQKKKKQTATFRNQNKNIDFFKILKNLQRKTQNRKSTPHRNQKTLNDLDNLLMNISSMGSKIKTQQNFKKIYNNLGTQTDPAVQRKIISRLIKNLTDSGTQTDRAILTDQKTQTDWEEDERAEELSNHFNRSLSFLDPINEENEENEKQDAEEQDDEEKVEEQGEGAEWSSDDENQVTVVERMQTTPARTPAQTPRKRRNVRLVHRMQTTPAKTAEKKVKDIQKRFASPMLSKRDKVRIFDRETLNNIRLRRTPIQESPRAAMKRVKLVKEARKAKVRGVRKAKQKALENLKALKSWKRI